MNTPLTKEEREDIAATITRTASQWGGGHKQLVRAMEAERYWRERCSELETIALENGERDE